MNTRIKLQPFLSILNLFLIIGAMLILTACSSTQASSGGSQAEPEQTSVQFSWLHTIEFVGFYEAIRQGYYTENNLEVRMDGGGFDEGGHYIDPIKQVVEGKSDFGVTGADVILAARSQGKPVVAVASIYQRSPVVLISLAEKNIIHPKDLAGKRVNTEPGTTVDVTYQALLKSQKIDRSQILETPRTDFTINPLFNNETDVLSGFITNDGVQAQLRSEALNFILPSDYGIDIYSNVIFTTEEMIKNKPDLVQAFVQATVKGMQWAVDHPEEASQYVLDQYGEGMPPDIYNSQKPGLTASLPLIKPAGSDPGIMTAENWEFTHQVLLEQGLLVGATNVEEAYNLSFLEKIYSE